MRLLFLALFLIASSDRVNAALVIDFEELNTYTGTSGVDAAAGQPGGQYYNGNDGSNATNSNGWSSQGAFFENSYNGDFLPDFDFWSGWAYSNVVNPVTAGFGNQYAAFPGGGSGPSAETVPTGQYAVVNASAGARFNLPSPMQLASLDLANTTYAGLAVRDGNDGGANFVSGAFGSQASGLDPNGNDFFRITIQGFDGENATGNATGSLTRYLADYRSDKSDNVDAAMFGNADYTLEQWLRVDLSSLGLVRSVQFTFETTDIGTFGPNTPFYAAVDNIAAVPEPSSVLLLTTCGIAGLRYRRRTCLR